MEFPILSADEFYSREEQYLRAVDPDREWENYTENETWETSLLSAALGAGQGKTALDCSCGSGNQTVTLARLGWQVTATDITEIYMAEARRRAQAANLPIRFLACDMRRLEQCFGAEFDCVVTCMALDNIPEDEGIRQALRAMRAVLKPGGKLYIRLRDFDYLMSDRPRYEFDEEIPLSYGKLYRMEDWAYESDGVHVVDIHVYWLRDDRKSGYPWSSEIFAYRRRALRRADLAAFMHEAGFHCEEVLPAQEGFFPPYEVLALIS